MGINNKPIQNKADNKTLDSNFVEETNKDYHSKEKIKASAASSILLIIEGITAVFIVINIIFKNEVTFELGILLFLSSFLQQLRIYKIKKNKMNIVYLVLDCLGILLCLAGYTESFF